MSNGHLQGVTGQGLGLAVAMMAGALLAGTSGCAENREDDRVGRRSEGVTRATPAAGAASPDVRALSILHATNLKEIQAGRLAQENAGSDDVRSYGEMLVRDHSANDERVQRVAREAGLTLMPRDQVERMMAQMEGREARPDPLAELRPLRGEAFDARFATRMKMGHANVVRTLQGMQGELRNPQVQELVSRSLPVLRGHESRARTLSRETGPEMGATVPPAPGGRPSATPPANPQPSQQPDW